MRGLGGVRDSAMPPSNNNNNNNNDEYWEEEDLGYGISFIPELYHIYLKRK
jgi:hypothetical protein